MLPHQDPSGDGLELFSNDICNLYFRGLRLWNIDAHSRQLVSERRQAYFKWLEYRVTEKRFRANPDIIPAIAQSIREIILYLGHEQDHGELQQLFPLMLKQFYQDLPGVLQSELETDLELRTYLQIETVESINLTLSDSETRLIFPASDFLPAIATAINGRQAELTALNSESTFRIQAIHQPDERIHLHFTEATTSTTFAWQDEAMLLASENPSVREQVLRRNFAWFDCDRTTYEKVVNEIVSTTDLRRRIDQANQWRRASAVLFYKSLQQQLDQHQEITIDDLIPPSSAGLLRHFQLDPTIIEQISFQEALEQAVASMLTVYDVETCIERFSCLPTKLPNRLKAAFLNLLPDERENLLSRLTLRLTSPICQLHLLDLALYAPTSINLVQQLLDTLLNETGALQFQLFGTILCLVDQQFSYWQEIREWSPAVRLAATWVHTSKLHNLFYDPIGTTEDFIRELNQHRQIQQISVDILDRTPEFWSDILHPRRLNRSRFAVGGIGAIVQAHEQIDWEALGIAQKLTDFACHTIENQPFLDLALWHDDCTLAHDCLGAFWGGNRSMNLATIFGADLSQQIDSKELKAWVETAIDSLATEPLTQNQWQLINAIVGDLPIYKDLAEKLSQLISGVDFVRLYEAEPMIGFTALLVACDHAANTADDDLRAKLEAELIAIARLIATQEQSVQMDKGISSHLLECAFKLTVRANNPRATSESLNSLLEKITLIWSRFLEVRAGGLSQVVLDLPVNQLHHAWVTTLQIRALRGHH